MENPLVEIDGGVIDSMVTEMHKTMATCIKTFQEETGEYNLILIAL